MNMPLSQGELDVRRQPCPNPQGWEYVRMHMLGGNDCLPLCDCPTPSSHTPSPPPHTPVLPTTTPASIAHATNPRKTAEEEERLRDGARSIVHFKLSPNRHALNVPKLDPKEKVWEHPTHHSVWTKEEVDSVQITHLPPADVSKGRMDGSGVCVLCGWVCCVDVPPSPSPLFMSHHHPAPS